MSSLKDIMDVDVEPLESQAMRSRQAAQQYSDLDQRHSSTSQSARSDLKDQPQVGRRRSNRVSKPSTQGTSSKPNISRRQSSGTAESMESDNYPPGSAQMSNASGLARRSSNTPESVRYTPVTGRVSRAKKGQPVHVCEQCDPPRIFTRAEHLRRHQLGHQKPAYPCTFEDCEKAFHRPDLLARHLNRHETQGEKAYKAGDEGRSRSSSTSSDSQSAPFKVQTPSTVDNSTGAQTSGTTNFAAPHTVPGPGNSVAAATFDSMVPNFPAVNFTTPSDEQSFNRFDQDSLGSIRGGTTVTSSMIASTMGTVVTSFPTSTMHSLSQGASLADMTPTSLRPLYPGQEDHLFSDISSPNGLPLLTLQVPDPPGLSYANSPWCSSDSTWSTPTDRYGNAWTRDRSVSIATNPEANSQTMAWSAYGNLPLQTQTPRNVGLEAVPENYESPPYVSPHLSPLNSSYPLARVSSPIGGYQELVGIPAFSDPYKMLAQSSPAPTTRLASSELGRPVSRTNVLVDIPHLKLLGGEVSTARLIERMEEYLVAYWAHLEPVYGIIHPETFDLHSSELVRKAMAALGSQFHALTGDRENGSELHDSCARMLVPHSQWSFQTMQAIFLSEIFGRFRSKKIDIRPSGAFRKLYKILVDASSADSKSRFARLDPQEISASIDLEVQHVSKGGHLISRQQALDKIWREWIEYEVRQRLRAACFLFDSHQRFCYEQRRVQPQVNGENTLIVIPCPKPLWSATTSQQWFEYIQKIDCSIVRLKNPEEMSAEEISRLPLAAQADAGALVASLLPSREELSQGNLNPNANAKLVKIIINLFPQFIHTHAYLALYYTPLHHLLSLTGNTWLFGQKLTSHSDIDAIAPAIRTWSSSPAAAHATWHAAHLLRNLFEAPAINRPFRGVSEYWFLYTATLVIWAFGHRNSILSVSGLSSASISRRASSVTLGSEDPTHGRAAAIAWTEAVKDLKPEQLFNSPLRTETAAVIDTARWTLEEESLMSHGRCGMLLDACGVLDRLREGGRLF